ncbi:hypothetical protein [Kocuria atrinae]|uniref:hypothetical protein n=1 Tax=Kocuria atrinae TaxID=592377 RepID=UPI0002D477F0|nr:hypothetical protein [Kocuria atrinae]
MRSAYGSGTGLLFLIAAIASVITLACVLLMKEIPLRTTVDIVEVDPETGELTVVSKRVDPVEAAGLRMHTAQTGSLPVIDPQASGLRRSAAEHADDAARYGSSAASASRSDSNRGPRN